MGNAERRAVGLVNSRRGRVGRCVSVKRERVTHGSPTFEHGIGLSRVALALLGVGPSLVTSRAGRVRYARAGSCLLEQTTRHTIGRFAYARQTSVGHMHGVHETVVDVVVGIALLGRRFPVARLLVQPHQMGHQVKHVDLGASVLVETAHGLSLPNAITMHNGE